jgi:hypothetical protein
LSQVFCHSDGTHTEIGMQFSGSSRKKNLPSMWDGHHPIWLR